MINLPGDSLAISPAAQRSETEQPSQRTAAYYAAILGLTVDGLAAYLFWSSDGSLTRLAMGMLVHLLSGVSVGILQWRCSRPPRKSRGAVVGLISVVFVPPIGAIAAAIFLIKCAGGESTRQPVSDPVSSAVKGELRNPLAFQHLIERGSDELLITAREIRPLVDVLKSDALEDKSAAVDMMVPQIWIDQVAELCKYLKSPNGKPPFDADELRRLFDTLQGDDLRLSVTKLRDLLDAPEADIRFRSSIGLLNIENQIIESIAAARSRDQHSPVTFSEVYILGLLYLTYARTELVDEITAAHYARLALFEFERCQEIDPSRSTHLERARCHMVCQNYQGCLTALAGNSNSDETAAQALIKMEAMFALGLYDDLKATAARAAANFQSDNAPDYSLIRWWEEGSS